MSTLEKVQLLEERINKAIALIEKLKSENAALKDDNELLQMHNDELKSYTTDFNKNSRLIEEGISSALTRLEQLEDLSERKAQEEEAEQTFSFEESGDGAPEEEHGSEQTSYTAPEDEDEDADTPLY